VRATNDPPLPVGEGRGEGGALADSAPSPARSASRAVSPRGRGDWPILAFALLAYAALAAGYITLTPIWQNPDEPAHFNYVAYVAHTGGLPELKAGDWDSALLERVKNGTLLPGDDIAAVRYEAWQPPLFYVAAAPVLLLGPQNNLEAEVLQLRALDAVFGALTVGVAYLVARQVLPAHLAVAVPLLVAGVPMFTSVSASISADPLANLLSAAILLVLVRRLRTTAEPCPSGPYPTDSGSDRPPTRRSHAARSTLWAIGAGILIGLGLLTKLAVGIFVPLALVVILVRSARPVRESLAMLASAAVVLLPWLVHQVTTYGWTDPLATSRHAAVVLDQRRFPGLSPQYVADFLTTTFHSFWAQFGWMGVVAPDRLYWAFGLLTLVAAGGLLLARRLFRQPAWQLMLATLGVAFVAYIGYNLAFEQFQGRYLFTALVPVAVLLVGGWSAWLPRRYQEAGTLVLSLALIALNGYALLRVLVPGFAPGG
jgi:4-amino-4-deoxy-L-arabinose transferase-like glycosyltransferase